MSAVTWATQHTNLVLGLVTLLFGSGVVISFGRAVKWAVNKRADSRRQSVRSVANFPFEVIKNSKDLLAKVMPGDQSDPLAASAITYLDRTPPRSTRKEFADRLGQGETRWLLLVGKGGTGKTREAAEIADLLMGQGWTVLLPKQNELGPPVTWPDDGVPRRKLLILLDDINQTIRTTRSSLTSGSAGRGSQVQEETPQARLLSTLKDCERLVGRAEVRVLATARNETAPDAIGESEWDMLGFDDHRALWDLFAEERLPEPEDHVVEQMLVKTAMAAGVTVMEPEWLVRHNDRTFENMRLNLRLARTAGTGLARDGFKPSQRGTWGQQYRETKKRTPAAAKLFEAVYLLRSLGAPVNVESVTRMAARSEPPPPEAQDLERWKDDLAGIADILHPRDGQIEAAREVEIEEAGESWEIEPHHVEQVTGILIELSENDPEDVAVPYLLKVGGTALMRGEFKDAVRLYTRAKDLRANDFRASYGLGKAYACLGHISDAITSYLEAVGGASDFFWAWYDLGLAQSELREFKQAADSLKEAKRLRPSDHRVCIARAKALGDLQNPKEAYFEYLTALALRPEDMTALRGKNEMLERLAGPPPVPDSPGPEPDQGNYQAWLSRGIQLLSEGATLGAARCFKAALDSDEIAADAWYLLGLASMSATEHEESPVRCFEEVLKIDPFFYAAHFDLGNLRRYAGYDEFEMGHSEPAAAHYEAAIAHYDKAIACQRSYADAWYGKALSLAGLGQHEKAIEHYKVALQLDRTFPAISYDLGNSLRKLGSTAAKAGDTGGAKDFYRQAVAAYKDELGKGDHLLAQYGLGLCYIGLGNYEDAVKCLDTLIEKDKGVAWYWYDKGRALSEWGRHSSEQGHFGEAVVALGRALKLKSPYPDASYELARAEAQQGHRGMALAALESLKAFPGRIEEARTDPVFGAIREDPRFRGMFENPPVGPALGGGH